MKIRSILFIALIAVTGLSFASCGNIFSDDSANITFADTKLEISSLVRVFEPGSPIEYSVYLGKKPDRNIDVAVSFTGMGAFRNKKTS